MRGNTKPYLTVRENEISKFPILFLFDLALIGEGQINRKPEVRFDKSSQEKL